MILWRIIVTDLSSEQNFVQRNMPRENERGKRTGVIFYLVGSISHNQGYPITHNLWAWLQIYRHSCLPTHQLV